MIQETLNNSERYCVFSCDEQWYGIPALSVRNILPCPDLTSVPFSDPILKGVSQVQNEFLPVVDLRALLEIQYEPTHDRTEQQVMVILGPSGPFGLLVDKATSLATLETSISNVSDQHDHWARTTLGTASFQDQVLEILDPNAVYEYAVSLIDGYWETSGQAINN